MVDAAEGVRQRGEPVGPGTCGIAFWWSRPPARSWKEQVIDMIGAPFWTACTRRVEKELPSRISSTAKRIGSVSSPGRMK